MENYEGRPEGVHGYILHLQKCRSSNPLMKIMQKNHKPYTAHCRSPFVDV